MKFLFLLFICLMFWSQSMYSMEMPCYKEIVNNSSYAVEVCVKSGLQETLLGPSGVELKEGFFTLSSKERISLDLCMIKLPLKIRIAMRLREGAWCYVKTVRKEIANFEINNANQCNTIYVKDLISDDMRTLHTLNKMQFGEML